jgi:hypothetical protein
MQGQGKSRIKAHWGKIKSQNTLFNRPIHRPMPKSEDSFLRDAGLETIKENKIPVYTADFPDLVELVEDDDRLKFLLFDGSVQDSVILEDITYQCPQRRQLPPNMQIPRLDKVLSYARNHGVTGDTGVSGECIACTTLYEKLLQMHQTVSELPEPGFYHILTLWDFHTFCQEKAQYSPIIYFYSVAERGKTRTMKGMVWVCKRGIRKGDIKDAQLIRDCTNLRASLAFDMTDFWESVKAAGSQDVILNRFEKGLTVSRVNRPEKGAFKDIDYYEVFGPTILATNEIISDIADTRAIPITMLKATRDFEDEVKQKDLLELNEELVAWRLVHGRDVWEQPKKILRSRLGDIIRPLHQVLLHIAPQYEEEFIKIVKLISETKLTEKSSSVTAEVLVAVKKICDEAANITNGVFPCQLVTNQYNTDKDEKEKIKSRRVGAILKSLGFKPTQTNNNTLGFIYKENLIVRLLGEYGVLVGNSPESPVSPESPDVISVQTTSICINEAVSTGLLPKEFLTENEPIT